MKETTRSNCFTDLLNNRKPVSILEDSFGETHFVGATETRVHRAKDFHELIDTASQFRRTSATEKNEQSSRSHAICKITITDPVTRAAPEGVLFLVDLAGSEAAQDVVNHATERMKETRDINVSLSVLKDCIRGRAQAGSEKGKKAYVPFRQSALTKTLKHLFDPTAGRDCKMSVVACINPSFLDVGASKNTLRYAEMLRVPVAMSKPLIFNENIPSTWNNTQLKKWISENVSQTEIPLIL
jgi:kinesin family protein 2/24